MKRLLKIIILSILILMSSCMPVKAVTEGMSQLRLKVVEAEEDYEIFMLLPKKYIKYAIQNDGLDIEYDGANTLKYNIIPSIVVDINKIQDNTYVDDTRIEYVQIKLDDLGGQEYVFEIIEKYTDMDMVYRVKSNTKDNIMLINTFTVEDNVCKIEYNYKENTIKTEKRSEIKFNFKISWWQIVIIIILIMFIVYIYRRRNY